MSPFPLFGPLKNGEGDRSNDNCLQYQEQGQLSTFHCEKSLPSTSLISHSPSFLLSLLSNLATFYLNLLNGNQSILQAPVGAQIPRRQRTRLTVSLGPSQHKEQCLYMVFWRASASMSELYKHSIYFLSFLLVLALKYNRKKR